MSLIGRICRIMPCLILLASAGLARADDGDVTLTASGSSFVYPFISKLASEYKKLHPNVTINYSSTGSGTGVKQFCNKATDFGATDLPMTDEQLKAAGDEVLHIPLTLGAVVPVYNVPGVAKPLTFSGPLLADIFIGKTNLWNDPAIAKLNPGVNLPNTGITIVHRSDGSGTTYLFTEYLSKMSPEFARKPGKGTTVLWPAEDKVGAKGGIGVGGIVAKTPNTIGYVELIDALRNQRIYGNVQNKAGNTVRGSITSVTAAAAGVKDPPADLRMSITNGDGDAAYPICAFCYVLVRKNPPGAAKGKALAAFLKWAVTDGQKFAPGLYYAPLPDQMVKLTSAQIDSIGR